MTIVVDDPLIAQMSISRTLPLHESSRRLRELSPECPRVYGVAVMSDLSRRRWWPLTDVLTTDRLQAMFDAAAAESDHTVAVAQQLAATLAHVVIGRVVPLLILEGRAWDTGLENLWVHVDSEGAIDWVGVVDPSSARTARRRLLQRPQRIAAAPPRQGPHRRTPERGRPHDVGGPPQPPLTRAGVQQAGGCQRRRNVDGRDVARRWSRRRQCRHPGSAVGRIQ